MTRQISRSVHFVDTFAGCGGMSLGLMQAGLSGLFAIESDRFAFASLKENFLKKNVHYELSWPQWLPQEPIAIEILIKRYRRELERLEGMVDLLAGGPPCQGFSSAGRRKHDDPRNQLFAHYVQLVEVLKPKALLIENVRGFAINFQHKGAIHNYAGKLRNLLSSEYSVYEELLDLSQFGVPQLRTRYFLLAFKTGFCTENPFDLLRRRLPSFLRSMRLQAPVSSWAAISDLEIARGGVQPSRDSKGFEEIRYTAPVTQYQKLMAGNSEAPTDLRLARHADDITERFSEIIELSHAEGRLNTSISDELRRRFGLKKRALRVLDPDRPSPTVTSMPDDLLHYSEPRTLTVRENARLQGFPDWFSFQGKYTTGGHLRRQEVPRFTQVANAVPPLVARAIGEILTEILTRRRPKTDNTERRPTSRAKRLLQSPEVSA